MLADVKPPDITATSYRGLIRPLDRSGSVASRLSTPGPYGRPGTPTTLLGNNTLSQLDSLSSQISETDPDRQRSQVVRERYQLIEQMARPQRPVMLSSVRSFSYEYPTQETELQTMMRAQSPLRVVAASPSVPTPNATPLSPLCHENEETKDIDEGYETTTEKAGQREHIETIKEDDQVQTDMLSVDEPCNSKVTGK